MFNEILVPLDGSDLSELILDRIEPILQLEYPHIHLLRAALPASADEDDPQTASAYLAEFAKTLSARRAKVTTHVVSQDPTEAILSFVQKNAPSLVAMSTHGASGLSRWIRGSVAERVLRRCPVPLLMANPEGVEGRGRVGFRRVLVPLDGSNTAAQILPLVKELAERYGAEVILLCVEPLHVATGPMGPPPMLANETELAERTLEPYVADLRAAGLEVEALAAVGPPAERILEAAEEREADLLAMTTHGRSGPSRWLFGSVAEKILRGSHCPLLLRRIAEVG